MVESWNRATATNFVFHRLEEETRDFLFHLEISRSLLSKNGEIILGSFGKRGMKLQQTKDSQVYVNDEFPSKSNKIFQRNASETLCDRCDRFSLSSLLLFDSQWIPSVYVQKRNYHYEMVKKGMESILSYARNKFRSSIFVYISDVSLDFS